MNYHFLLSSLILVATQNAQAQFQPYFYSAAGREHVVTFNAEIDSDYKRLSDVAALSDSQKKLFVRYTVMPLIRYMFGPTTHRSLGGTKRQETAIVEWSKARLVEGRVVLPYSYEGLWILDKDVAARGEFQIPVPRNEEKLMSPKWKNCTDSDPSHQTQSFYWYFWDPSRYGCDHAAGIQYDEVTLRVGAETTNEQQTYPEYEKMLKSNGIDNNLQMTVAFGYVEDPIDPNPDKDSDAGIYEYRKFLKMTRSWLPGFKESMIYQREYEDAQNPSLVIGRRFQGLRNGVQVTLNVVTSAGVDQMMLFAKSFAHDHDAFFAWMGHSRVGSGFDADQFRSIVESNPSYYSVSPDYQMIYWGGCNSYSYYSLPFFKFKAEISGGTDPEGTKGLDIIAHGLPSYFSLNAVNAASVVQPLLNWTARPSYQEIVNGVENNASMMGTTILAAILGDEDNAR